MPLSRQAIRLCSLPRGGKRALVRTASPSACSVRVSARTHVPTGNAACGRVHTFEHPSAFKKAAAAFTSATAPPQSSPDMRCSASAACKQVHASNRGDDRQTEVCAPPYSLDTAASTRGDTGGLTATHLVRDLRAVQIWDRHSNAALLGDVCGSCLHLLVHAPPLLQHHQALCSFWKG